MMADCLRTDKTSQYSI